MKYCHSCNRERKKSEFWKRKASPDGLQRICKECSLSFNNAWRRSHKEKIKVIKRKHYEKNKVMIYARSKTYAMNHPEVNRKAVKKWREKNLERAKFLIKRWCQNNPEKRRHSFAVRRFLKRANGGEKIPLRVWDGIKNIFGNKCFYCGKKRKLTMDHYIPLSKGGLHIMENIVPACVSCNCRKSNMPAEVFLERRKVFA